MNVEEIESPPPLPKFVTFSIRIDIENRDQLEALRVAAAHMTNGHGLELYDLLEAKARQLL